MPTGAAGSAAPLKHRSAMLGDSRGAAADRAASVATGWKESAMTDLVDTVLAHIGDPQLAQIAAQLGTTPDQARAAVEHALPLIVGGMAHNASTQQGADALHDALGDHAGQDISSILGNMLGGAGGSGIGGSVLGNIFGGQQDAA